MRYRRGVRIHLRFSFFVFNALIFLLHDSRLILGFYTVCALHEAGHIAAASLMGVKLREVEVTGFGIVMKTSAERLCPRRTELIVLLAGPCANLLAYAFMKVGGSGGELAYLELAAAVYNLLPYRQLDGGALLSLLAEGSEYEDELGRCLAGVKAGISAVLLVVTLYAGHIAAPLFIASVILFISEKR